jgi:hypothetical protein
VLLSSTILATVSDNKTVLVRHAVVTSGKRLTGSARRHTTFFLDVCGSLVAPTGSFDETVSNCGTRAQTGEKCRALPAHCDPVTRPWHFTRATASRLHPCRTMAWCACRMCGDWRMPRDAVRSAQTVLMENVYFLVHSTVRCDSGP